MVSDEDSNQTVKKNKNLWMSQKKPQTHNVATDFQQIQRKTNTKLP